MADNDKAVLGVRGLWGLSGLGCWGLNRALGFVCMWLKGFMGLLAKTKKVPVGLWI